MGVCCSTTEFEIENEHEKFFFQILHSFPPLSFTANKHRIYKSLDITTKISNSEVGRNRKKSNASSNLKSQSMEIRKDKDRGVSQEKRESSRGSKKSKEIMKPINSAAVLKDNFILFTSQLVNYKLPLVNYHLELIPKYKELSNLFYMNDCISNFLVWMFGFVRHDIDDNQQFLILSEVSKRTTGIDVVSSQFFLSFMKGYMIISIYFIAKKFVSYLRYLLSYRRAEQCLYDYFNNSVETTNKDNKLHHFVRYNEQLLEKLTIGSDCPKSESSISVDKFKEIKANAKELFCIYNLRISYIKFLEKETNIEK